MKTYTLAEANKALPLVQAIAREVLERRRERRDALRQIRELEQATSPEGLCQSLSELDAHLYQAEEGLRNAKREYESLGLTVLRLNPVTIHFPGRTRTESLVFCWQEGEDGVGHGHPTGEENEPRRPLRVRSAE